MARLPDELIERIKSEVPLLRLLKSQGYVFKKHGKDYVCRCPFHADKTPSLVISPDSNLWHCLGACQVGGSVIDWEMRTKGLSFRAACDSLQQQFLTTVGEGDNAQSKRIYIKQHISPLASDLAASDDDQKLFHHVVDFYHQSLKQSPDALAYLKRRGLHNAELIDHFKLGFANHDLLAHLPPTYRKGGEVRSQLQRIGIIREKNGHEHLQACLVVPVFDEAGHVTEMYGRKITDHLPKTRAFHVYLPGPHQGIFNAACLPTITNGEIILCEALIDALTFWQHGFKNVTASYGVEGFTADHLRLFTHYNIKRVLIAYDADEAGNKAAAKLTLLLAEHNITGVRVCFPPGLDANEFALHAPQPTAVLDGLLHHARAYNQKIETPLLAADKNPLLEQPVIEKSEPTKKTITTEKIEKTSQHEHGAKNKMPAMENTTTPALPPYQLDNGDLTLRFTERDYRVRGLDKNTKTDQLKVNLRVSHGDLFHVDVLDLYSAKARSIFIRSSAVELLCHEDALKIEVGKVMRAIESYQDEQRLVASREQPKQTIELTPDEQAQALALLQSPDLLEQILIDFNRCGVVGEEINKLTGYVACVSRKLDKPLAILIQSTSAAGKSSLMEAILALMPEEERVQYSAMTGQSLFYMGQTNLKHKILAIAEEEGAHNASYALKLLQSEGEVTIASTGKDEQTGDLITKEYKVEGPVMLFLTTTAIDIDEELLNRCLVLTVNESREQTRAIHAQQRARRTLQGLHSKIEKQIILTLHRNAQRLLKPLHVINPYADQLTFLDNKTRMRRDHEKYLTLIDSIALLHQYQRPTKTINSNGTPLDYIEVTLTDIEKANQLAHEILGRTLDELPPQTRNLLKLIKQMVSEQCSAQHLKQRDYRFSRRDIRVYTAWSDGQLKIHCKRLEELEYLMVHRGSRGHWLNYELLFDGEVIDDQSHATGLLDTDHLKKLQPGLRKLGVNERKSGESDRKLGSSQGQVSPKSGLSQPSEIAKTIGKNRSNPLLAANITENALLQSKNNELAPACTLVEAAL